MRDFGRRNLVALALAGELAAPARAQRPVQRPVIGVLLGGARTQYPGPDHPVLLSLRELG